LTRTASTPGSAAGGRRCRSGSTYRRTPGVVPLLAAFLLAGCGPTRTPGTTGVARKELASLRVPQHNDVHGWRGERVHVAGVKIDGVEYPKRGDVEFLLVPGDHTIEVFYGHCVHGPALWLNPFAEFTIEPPHGQLGFAAAAGRGYVLTGFSRGGRKLMEVRHDVRDATTGESAVLPDPSSDAPFSPEWRPATGPIPNLPAPADATVATRPTVRDE
jgi:hypothetical protein